MCVGLIQRPTHTHTKHTHVGICSDLHALPTVCQTKGVLCVLTGCPTKRLAIPNSSMPKHRRRLTSITPRGPPRVQNCRHFRMLWSSKAWYASVEALLFVIPNSGIFVETCSLKEYTGRTGLIVNKFKMCKLNLVCKRAWIRLQVLQVV